MTSENNDLSFTGERMMPGASDVLTFWEHIHRYRFARAFVAGKRVLDVACGEGYGAAAMKQAGAKSVIGLDISEKACRHAKDRYGLDAREGNATALPLPDKSVDVVISFETLEHVAQQDVFMNECRRVLTSKGCLIVSTPVKETYRATKRCSDWHCAELTRDEFEQLLKKRFQSIQLFGQQNIGPQVLGKGFLASKVSPWLRIPGCPYVRKQLLCRNGAHLVLNLPSDEMKDAVKWILKQDGWGEQWVNPYLPWKIHRRDRRIPIYLIAVARGGRG